MDFEISTQFVAYARAKSATEKIVQKDTQRRSLLNTAQLLKTVLLQQLSIEHTNSNENHNNNSLKQDLTKAQHEKKLLENKLTLLNSEIDTWKKKSSVQTNLQKENQTLKNQVSKLNSQLNEAKNETTKTKQQFATQKAVLESKLETAKKNIKNLKDNKGTSTQIAPPSLVSPIKLNATKPGNNAILKKPLVSDFSVSPFLHKATKPASSNLVPKEVSTPLNNNVLAQSTPGFASVSPLKRLTGKSTRGPSGLKNLLSPEKSPAIKKTKSLFDDDEEDLNDDFFSTSVKTGAKDKSTTTSKDTEKADDTASTGVLNRKTRKRKLGGKQIIEEADVDDENNYNKFSPLKKVKLLDKIGGISPLKQRNKERNLFRI